MFGLESDFPVAFYFKVYFFSGLIETAFKEVSGLKVERGIETIQEGGVNSFEHKLPKHIVQSNLVLKKSGSPLATSLEVWIKYCVEGGLDFPIVPQDIFIYLLNAEGIPLRGWACTNAYPVKWEADNLDSEKNGIMIETLELAYQELRKIL